jgi:hypothetical protein
MSPADDPTIFPEDFFHVFYNPQGPLDLLNAPAKTGWGQNLGASQSHGTAHGTHVPSEPESPGTHIPSEPESPGTHIPEEVLDKLPATHILLDPLPWHTRQETYGT